jgi:drug/metabolite transporter (DMT)-like permease
MPLSRGYGLALLTVLFWSTVATAFKLSLRYLDLFQLIFYACLTSTVVLLIAVVVQGHWHGLRSTLHHHWRLSLVSALLNPFAYYLILFAAYDRLPAQVAQPINYTWAIVLTLLSIVVLKQKVTLRDLLAAGICYIGVVIIVAQGDWRVFNLANPAGIALALLSTFVWATYWILNIRDPREPTIALCANFIVALPVTLVLCLALSDPFDVPIEGLFGAVWVGMFEMGLAFLAWSEALRLAENTSRVSNLIFLSPFLSLILIHQVLGEPIYATTFVGLGVIVAGLLLQRSANEHPEAGDSN